MCMSNLAGAAHRIRGLGTRSDRTNAERVSEAPTSVVLNASPCTQAYTVFYTAVEPLYI